MIKKYYWIPASVLLAFLLLHFTVFSNQPERKMLPAQPKQVMRVVKSNVSMAGPMTMKQPLPSRGLENLDPFLLLHHHGPNTLPPNNPGLPFGPHPHRGFETVTFIYEGAVKHEDSNGFKSVINAGGIQWMTAAGGIVHSERSPDEHKKTGGRMEFVQLWINLPRAMKMEKPNYIGLQKEAIPSVSLQNGKVKIDLVSGSFEGQQGPAQGLYPVNLATVTMQKGSAWTYQVEEDHAVLFYVLEGVANINNQVGKGHDLVLFSENGNQIQVEATEELRFIIGTAQPIKEPIVSHGPFVMTNEEELYQAIEDYQYGRMGYLKEN